MWSSGPFEETMLGKFEEKEEKKNLTRTGKVQTFQNDEEGDEDQRMNDEAILAALGINEIGAGLPTRGREPWYYG